MEQITVNGILVNAIISNKRYTTVDFREAERLVKGFPDLSFDITDSGRRLVTLENIESLRNQGGVNFYIRTAGTHKIKTSNDMEFDLDEVGYTCIENIAAHLKRLGGKIDYDQEIEDGIRTEGSSIVHSLELVGDEVVVDFYGWGSVDRTLKHLFFDHSLSVRDLIELLKEIEKEKAIVVKKVAA